MDHHPWGGGHFVIARFFGVPLSVYSVGLTNSSKHHLNGRQILQDSVLYCISRPGHFRADTSPRDDLYDLHVRDVDNVAG